jgi:hypothetical protein
MNKEHYQEIDQNDFLKLFYENNNEVSAIDMTHVVSFQKIILIHRIDKLEKLPDSINKRL